MKRISDLQKQAGAPDERKSEPNTMLSSVRHDGDYYQKGDVVSDPKLQEIFRAKGLIL